jgi:hypothetical protein
MAAELERLLRCGAPTNVQVEFSHFPSDPVLFDRHDPVLRALSRVCGPTTAFARSGGSVPVVAALAARRVPTVVTRFSLADDVLHAPNESYSLRSLELGDRPPTNSSQPSPTSATFGDSRPRHQSQSKLSTRRDAMESSVNLDSIDVAPEASSWRRQHACRVVKYVGPRAAVLLARHGVVAVGAARRSALRSAQPSSTKRRSNASSTAHHTHAKSFTTHSHHTRFDRKENDA